MMKNKFEPIPGPTEEDGFEVVTAPEDFNAVRDALVEKGV